MMRVVLFMGFLLLVAGCGSTRRGEDDATEQAEQRRAGRDVITADQIAETRVRTAYDAVQRLHPLWLQRRGRRSFSEEGGVVVYVDNFRMGYAEALAQVGAEAVNYIEYFDAASATQRWGTNHTHGAIQVITRGKK